MSTSQSSADILLIEVQLSTFGDRNFMSGISYMFMKKFIHNESHNYFSIGEIKKSSLEFNIALHASLLT
jgi:hypothetical protein